MDVDDNKPITQSEFSTAICRDAWKALIATLVVPGLSLDRRFVCELQARSALALGDPVSLTWWSTAVAEAIGLLSRGAKSGRPYGPAEFIAAAEERARETGMGAHPASREILSRAVIRTGEAAGDYLLDLFDNRWAPLSPDTSEAVEQFVRVADGALRGAVDAALTLGVPADKVVSALERASFLATSGAR